MSAQSNSSEITPSEESPQRVKPKRKILRKKKHSFQTPTFDGSVYSGYGKQRREKAANTNVNALQLEQTGKEATQVLQIGIDREKIPPLTKVSAVTYAEKESRIRNWIEDVRKAVVLDAATNFLEPFSGMDFVTGPSDFPRQCDDIPAIEVANSTTVTISVGTQSVRHKHRKSTKLPCINPLALYNIYGD